jgi:peptidylprolyl isomerase
MMCMRWRALIVAVPLVMLAACAPSPSTTSSTASSDTATSSGTGTTATTTSSPVTLGPTIPPDTAVAKPVDPSLMPTVTGEFGKKPTITVPSTPPPTTLQRQVLIKGTGKTLTKGSWAQVHYLGQVWGGKVFDNSYDKGQLFSFQIGAAQQQVVSGWDVGLEGMTQGSRVLLVFPSQDGYGAAGQGADIPGGATLIFVVDIINVIPPGAAGQTDATPQTPPSDIAQVTGALGKEPSIKIPSGLAAPTKARTVVLAKGTGAPAASGNVLVQYVVTSWDGTQTESSWPGSPNSAGSTAGPQELPLDSSQAFASLVGVPIGSRVYMELPADSSSGQPALAWVFDLVLQVDKSPSTTGTQTASGAGTGTPTASGTGSPAATSSAAPGSTTAPTS